MDAPNYYECPRCGARSFNPNDIAERYCGRCHQWEAVARAKNRDELREALKVFTPQELAKAGIV